MKQYIDEDYFWEKYKYLDKLNKAELKHLMFSFGSVAEDFSKQGKLSKITANRVKEGCYRLCSDSKEKPSELDKRLEDRGYSVKKIDSYLFKNSFKKFIKVSIKEKHKQLKKKIKFWEKVRLDSVLY